MPSTVDQGQLIWTGGVVGYVLFTFLCFLNVSNDGMTESESFVEPLQLLIILMIWILDVILEFRVLEIDIGNTWWILKWLRIIYTILELTSRETFELHDVLCESASFIAKDIVHHTQLFIQV